MRQFFCRILLAYLAGIYAAQAAEPTESELEAWFEDDSRSLPQRMPADEGTLQFLATPPQKRTPTSTNVLRIGVASRQEGWVEITQCHRQLDPISRVEVIYQYQQMRNLRIRGTKNIGKTWVEDSSVQMEDVKENAELCVELEARVLYRQDDGSFILRNGPFQRRFLDGFFPMHTVLDVDYRESGLYFADVTPGPAPGFSVTSQPGRLKLDAWFEGQLTLAIRFSPAP